MAKSKPKKQEASRAPLLALGIGCGFLSLLVLLCAGGAGGYWLYQRNQPAGALARPSTPAGALATELDKSDPDWTFDAIIAKWRATKIDKNGADLVLEASRDLPKDWDADVSTFGTKPMGPSLSSQPALARKLRDKLDRFQPTVTKARQFASLPQGRFAVEIKANPLAIKVGHLNDLRKIEELLQLMAIRDTLDDRPEDALQAIQGIVQISRYAKEEPFTISHIMRAALALVAADTLEDVFRYQLQKEPGEASLAALQELLWAEGADTGILYSLHCERGGMFHALEQVRTKKLKLSDVARDDNPNLKVTKEADQAAVENAGTGQQIFLTKINEAIAIARLPTHQQHDRFVQWESALRNGPKSKETALGSSLLPAVSKLYKPQLYCCAKMRATATALAVERYRRANQSWPADLATLVPKYLPSVPVDPYDGNPLRYQIYDDGVAIMCVGVRRQPPPQRFLELDQRGQENIVSFRLWQRPLRKAVIKGI